MSAYLCFQNRYSRETIHVANWLMLSGFVDVDDLIAAAAHRVDVADYNDGFLGQFASELEDAFHDAVRDAVPEYMAPYEVGFETYDHCADCYDGSMPDFLVRPMLGAAIENVDFDHVTELVIESKAAATVA